MVDVVLLNNEIEKMGASKVAIARNCGISRPTLDKYLKYPEKMTCTIAKRIANCLNITEADKLMSIFFAPDVQTNVNE